VSSDLPRAAQTAEVIAGPLQLKVDVSSALRERHFGPYEGMTAEQLRAARQQLGVAQTGDLADWTGMPQIESTDAVWLRVSGFLQELSHRYPGQDLLVVTHGGVIARVVSRSLGIPEGSPRRFALSNGIVAVLEFRDPSFWLLSLADLPLIYSHEATPDTATAQPAK
jgi:broad specificity phosphatase PhoE